VSVDASGDAEPGVVADEAVSATVQAPSGSLLEAVAAVASATYEAVADDNVATLTSHIDLRARGAWRRRADVPARCAMASSSHVVGQLAP
jgi:hypothetical protein